jgi:hypothetical protein
LTLDILGSMMQSLNIMESFVADEPKASQRIAKMADIEPTELPAAQGIVTTPLNVSAITPRGAALRSARTAQDETVHHNISGDELASLGEMKRDHLWDFMWVMLGIAIGAAPSALDHIYRHFWIGVDEHLTLKGLAEILITVTGGAIFLVLFLAVYSSKRTRPD